MRSWENATMGRCRRWRRNELDSQGQYGKRAARSLCLAPASSPHCRSKRGFLRGRKAALRRAAEVNRKDLVMTSLLGRWGALALAGGLAMTAGSAWAQGAQKPAAPVAPAPAAPASPGQPAPVQTQGPVKLDLQPSQANWTKICG